MTQEYLFTTDEFKEDVEEYDFPDGVNKSITVIKNSPCWILRIYIDGESEDSAKIIDTVNTQICEKYKPTVLVNECSAYFNKSLFPIANEFERKLRKLLYLASSLQDDDKTHDAIHDLETRDLGDIFEVLFTDENFIKTAKETINKKTWKYTKKEVISSIEKLEENILWDDMLGANSVMTLKNNFFEIRNYRNDIMHAHNIDYTRYKEAKKLFQKTNKEIDVSINELIEHKDEKLSSDSANFNSVLISALSALQNNIDVSKIAGLVEAMTQIFTVQTEVRQTIKEMQSEFDRLSTDEALQSKKLVDEISEFNRVVKESTKVIPSKEELEEIQSGLQIHKSDVTPRIVNTQNEMLENLTDLRPEDDNQTNANKEGE